VTRILFCGVGALGSTAVTLCRNLPVALSFADFDRVESKNVLAQAFTRQAVGKNKAEALRLQLRTFFGVEAQAFPVRLAAANIDAVAAGADLLVDCLDNIAGRRVVLDYATRTGTASVHAGLAADGLTGLIRWRERFAPDAEDTAGQATCEDGAHLPFIGLVAATLAGIVADFVSTADRRDALLTPYGRDA
jgi:molybdopterin/thiamine biosynthesis adenylyltransferase